MQEFQAKLEEIQDLLAEAYEHYFEHSDGHCKSGEGAISVNYPPFFWEEATDPGPGLSIYSYVLGPHRNHYFDNIDAALEAVRQWHADEMTHDYARDEEEWEEAVIEWANDQDHSGAQEVRF